MSACCVAARDLLPGDRIVALADNVNLGDITVTELKTDASGRIHVKTDVHLNLLLLPGSLVQIHRLKPEGYGP